MKAVIATLKKNTFNRAHWFNITTFIIIVQQHMVTCMSFSFGE